MPGLFKGVKKINNEIKEFFTWLLVCLNEDIRTIKDNNYTDLYEEYNNVKKLLIEKRNNFTYRISNDFRSKLKDILLTYKEEYSILQKYKKDIFFYNDLLGWYKDIPEDLDLFINNHQ